MTWAVQSKYWIWWMLLVALLLRLGTAGGVQLHVSQTPGRLCLITGDAEGYWELAGKVAAGEDYSIFDPPRRVMRMPGFPALLALPRLVFDNNPFVARLVLAVVGTFACGFTYWLGRELGGNVVGLIAGTYTAVSPTMILLSVLFLSETAFAAGMLASLIAAAKLVRFSSRQSRLAFVTGVLIGVATYLRPTWFLVGPGLGFLVVVFGQMPIRSRLISAACLCFGLGVTMSPWTVRNTVITGHVIPTTLWVGPSLYDGLNPNAMGDSDMEFFDNDNFLQSMSEYDMDRKYRQLSWAFATANPGRVVWLALVKQVRYWSPAPNSPQFGHVAIQTLAWAAFLPLICFSVAGAWLARRDIWLLVLTAAPIFYFAGLHLLFVGSLRYRLPAEYPLAVLAAVGFVRLFGPNKTATVS